MMKSRLASVDEFVPHLREELGVDLAVVLLPARASRALMIVAADGRFVPAAWRRGEPVRVTPRRVLTRVPQMHSDLTIHSVIRGEHVALRSALVIPLTVGGHRAWLLTGTGSPASLVPAAFMPERADELEQLLELERLRQQHGVYRQVFRAAARLSRVVALGGGMNGILQTAVSGARELIGTDAAYISLPRATQDESFHMAAFDNVRTSAFRSLRVAYGEGLGGLARARRKPVLVLDYGADRRLKNAPVTVTLREGFRVAASVPLLAGREITGCLYIANRRDHRLSEDDLEMLRLYGDRVADALGCVMERDSVQARARQQEREALTYELHDTVLRAMLEISLEAESGRSDSGNPAASLEAIAQSAHHTLAVLRQTLAQPCRQPRPRALSEIAGILRETTQLRPMRREVIVLGEDRSVAAPIAETLLSVASEAIANAEQHSSADVVEVRLELRAEEVILVVHDSGHGLARTDAARPHHFGLAGMRHRVDAVNGQLWFETPQTGGFAVHASLPTCT